MEASSRKLVGSILRNSIIKLQSLPKNYTAFGVCRYLSSLPQSQFYLQKGTASISLLCNQNRSYGTIYEPEYLDV
jgi:hypothetical protein